MLGIRAQTLGVCLSFGLMGCAGPTTPFGALNGFGKKAMAWTERAFSRGSGPQISFTPRRQVLHDRTRFDVHVYDPAGVPEEYELYILYNGQDVTSSFLSRAEREFIDLNNRELRFTVNDLRLKARSDHNIKVVYRRDRQSEPVAAEFHPPTCAPFEPERSLASLADFEAPPDYVNLINKHARRRKLNPYYVAGLIAQESMFDPTAISKAKALGLTQITSLGEGEILKKYPDWPRYEGISEMSVIELKLAVMSGKVNARNEWRLDPDRSIRGGVDYLGYLSEYWNRPDKKEARREVDLSEVLLASYNSGAARVSRALERKGKDFLKDDELREARAYVRKVVSYCDHLSRPEVKR